MFCLFVCFGGKQVNNHTLHLFCSEGCTSCYQKEQKMGQVRQEEGGSYHKLNGVFPGAVLGAASPPSAHPAHSSHPLWLCSDVCEHFSERNICKWWSSCTWALCQKGSAFAGGTSNLVLVYCSVARWMSNHTERRRKQWCCLHRL